MCVGFTNGYEDFSPSKSEDALNAMIPGSAIGFNRIGFYHFAIFLGWAWPKGGGSDPIPLLCHLSGDAGSKPMASVRLTDVRDVVQNSEIRVYKCSCSASKRSEVILGCLYRVGKEGYNVVTNNCEHFVREVINGNGVSYQALMTLTVPVVQLPRLIVGGAIGGTICLSASSKSSGYMDHYRSLGLISPDMDLIEILVSNRGLKLKGVRKNSCCTNEFSGSSHFPMQMLFLCSSCGDRAVCKPCSLLCHPTCGTQGGRVTEEPCSCAHTKKARSASPVRLRIHGPRRPRNSDENPCFPLEHSPELIE